MALSMSLTYATTKLFRHPKPENLKSPFEIIVAHILVLAAPKTWSASLICFAAD